MKLSINHDLLLDFLKSVDKSFPTPLSEKQSLNVLTNKFLKSATLCAEFADNRIISLVAGYTENLTNNTAFISVVATLEGYHGQGVATKLIKEFIDVCIKKKIDAVHLYAVESNTVAVNMYKKFGFTEMIIEDEPRKDDLHLIYYIKEE